MYHGRIQMPTLWHPDDDTDWVFATLWAKGHERPLLVSQPFVISDDADNAHNYNTLHFTARDLWMDAFGILSRAGLIHPVTTTVPVP